VNADKATSFNAGGGEDVEVDAGWGDAAAGYNPAEEAAYDEGRGGDLPAFGHYVAIVQGGSGRRLPFGNNDLQGVVKTRIIEGPSGTVNRFCTGQITLAPRYEKKVGAAWVPISDEAGKAEVRKKFQDLVSRFTTRLKLKTTLFSAPATEDGIGAWLAPAEGVNVVFAAYTDKKGYTAINWGSLRSPDEPARDRKGVIPGLTALEQARKEIAAYDAKGGK
jgi:hypothetical protein